jgi:N-hydroxyarylamine O-acetyltransferase
MATSIDLDAYFQRIGFAGDRLPTLDTLRAILARHPEAIPFENLNPLLGWPVPLDASSLEQKLMRDGRGGYCFEQNLLLRDVLEALGFSVVGLAARVLWNAPEGAVTARSHMLLEVDLGGQFYIADVGFGGQCLTGPLRLEPEIEQATPHEPFRLLSAGDECTVAFVLQSKIAGTWKSLYRFDLQPQELIDYEVSNWYVSTHPRSHFVTSLVAARVAPGRRFALRNNELAIHDLQYGTERRVFDDASDLRQTLEDTFRLTLPDAPELDAALARITSPPA